MVSSPTHAFERSEAVETIGGTEFFWWSKRVFDIVVSLALLPAFALFAIALLALNPFYNQGSLFYIQTRMGKNCRAFKAIKFRSMRSVQSVRRGPNDPIEQDRITPLGNLMRKTRIDELPQIINVLRGDMSLIGPRPDYFSHARSFLRDIPEYRARHAVRPGISGLAQVELGYIEGTEATRQKALADLRYIQNAGFAMDSHIFAQTLVTVILGKGA